MDRGRVMGAGDAVPARFKSSGLGQNQMGEFEVHMKSGKLLCRTVLCVLVALFAGSVRVWAQKTAVPSRVVEAVDDTQTVRLQGNVHPLARAAYDQGALPDSQPMTRMLLVLQRSPEQELALQQLLDAQQTKGSGSYHTWLTPAQFGTQYGPSDADVQAVTSWLTRQGFQVANVATGRNTIEFNGNVGQVRTAFHTEIHRYVMNGEEHFANASDPAIPQALAPVVKGVAALHNFPKHSYLHNAGLYRRTKATGELSPLFSYGNPLKYAMGPADFAAIYNVPATVGGQPAGTGQTIAITGDSNINVADIQQFRSLFGLPANFTQSNVIVNGPDPGILAPNPVGTLSDESEADGDIEWAGAIAPNATILFVTSESTISNPTQVTAGIDLSALYVVDNNLAPVMSESFGECEAGLLTAGNAFYNALWEQAAAQGITVAIAAGDNGPAACDPIASLDPNAATQGIAVSGVASTPFNVAVGGTDWDPVQVQNPATYWNSTNAANTQESAIGYIPEVPWDDSACALNLPALCTSVNQNGADISAGSGGPSNCVQTNVNNSNGNITCVASGAFPNGGYPKPSWQIGITPTPTDNVRDLPDVSFFASDGFFSGVAYIVCESDQDPNGAACSLNSPFEDFIGVGGTSLATPAFAAVMALVNQQTGERQGNANYVLYGLAAKETYSSCKSSLFSPTSPAPAGCVFYDMTTGNNAVACDGGSPNCSNSVTGDFGVTVYSLDNGNPAFQAVQGYDLATGLGTINVGNLLASWTTPVRTATSTTLKVLTQTGQSLTATATVTSATGSPTGDASLTALDGSQNVLGSFGPFTLTNGIANMSTALLPAGTVSLEAIYGGDATHAISTSTVPLSSVVAGAGFTSKVTVAFVSYNTSSGAPTAPTTSAQNFPYGTPYFVTILVTKSDGTSCAFGYPNTKPTSPGPVIPCPTGTISLFDNGNPQNDFLNTGIATNTTKVNNLGLAEDQSISLSATLASGTTPAGHNLTATYSNAGDPNYSAATSSNTMSITISKATPTVAVASSLGTITSGTSVTLQAQVNTSGNGLAPCGVTNGGTVQFTNNGAALAGTVTYTPTNGTPTTLASCTATLTTTISAVYPAPKGGPGTPWMPVTPIALAMISLVLFALGWKWMPQPRRRAYAYAGLVAFALLAAGIAGCGGGSGGGGGGGGTRTIGATYSGDSNYASASGTTTIVVQ